MGQRQGFQDGAIRVDVDAAWFPAQDVSSLSSQGQVAQRPSILE